MENVNGSNVKSNVKKLAAFAFVALMILLAPVAMSACNNSGDGNVAYSGPTDNDVKIVQIETFAETRAMHKSFMKHVIDELAGNDSGE